MNKLLDAVSRDFPGAEPSHLFEAGIPVYFIRLLVEALEPQELSNFEIYFLHALALGVQTREAIAELLGLEDRDLLTPGSSLLKRELIVQAPSISPTGRNISLTEKGKEVLASHIVPPVPVRASAQIHLNAMTWTAIPLEETWSLDQMERNGLCILPTQRHERPTLGDFTVKEVDNALRYVPYFRDTRLIKLIQLKKVAPEYIAPVFVVASREQGEKDLRFGVYRGEALLRGESVVLQRLYETGHFLLPDDAVSLDSKRLEVPASLPAPVTQLAQALNENSVHTRSVQQELSSVHTRRQGTNDLQEQTRLKERIATLEAQLQVHQSENEHLSIRLKQNQGTFLRTEEHRGVLERALKEAREEIVIISPWLNRRTCDDSLCGLVAEAIKRSVRVRIGYGITERPGDPDIGRNRANAQKVIWALKAAVSTSCSPEQTALLDILRTNDTHEKILVCDQSFAVVGSFNWLSYRGDVDSAYRNETSVLLRDPVSIAELARIALRGWTALKE